MPLFENLLIRLSSNQVGTDESGNKYFISKYKDSYGNYRRRVIYNGIAEPSKIQSTWYLWIHYLTDDVPVSSNKYKWQKKSYPNLTGSKMAHQPKNIKNPENIDYNKFYEAWKPKGDI